ncbi:Chaperone protein focC precursor [Pragia fontium]|uniref:fimbrial biogenesis chaperone n=1 Tax=Pragia fontium TaxID=82985 RepID=UPI000DFB595D|nr:molecular chaperone [Pragia fontium]SUB82592.1 Chaperone protein focC precursor [Pragia fontium]
MLLHKKLFYRTLVAFLGIGFLSQCFASGVGINATRVIFTEGNESASVTIRNKTTDESYLVQSYMTGTQQNGSAPFEVLPPMFRLGPDSRNEVRIVEKNHQLPKDRESVFYFHARAISASNGKTEGKENNGVIKIALENVIKVFYRPKNLPSSPEKAQSGLVFESVSGGFKVKNPSPYYINLTKMTVNNKSIPLSIEKNNAMIMPFGEIFYATPNNKGKVTWSTINDLGGHNEYNQKI